MKKCKYCGSENMEEIHRIEISNCESGCCSSYDVFVQCKDCKMLIVE